MKLMKTITILTAMLLIATTTLAQNIRDGELKLYRDNGTIKRVITYKDGLMHGPEKVYNKDGKTLSWINYYKENERIGTIYYDNNGVETERSGTIPNDNNDNNGSAVSCVVCSKKIYPNSGTGNYYSLYYWASPKIGGLGCTQRSTKERPTSKMKGMGPYCSSSCCNSSSAKSGRAAPYNK